MAALVALAGSDTGFGCLRGLQGMILMAGILGSPILTGVAALVIFVFFTYFLFLTCLISVVVFEEFFAFFDFVFFVAVFDFGWLKEGYLSTFSLILVFCYCIKVFLIKSCQSKNG